MKWARIIEKTFKALLPSPFTIAIALTIVTFALAFFLTPARNGYANHFFDIADYWQRGLWTDGLLVFAFQMMLMLVLGHALALTKMVDRVIVSATQFCNSTANAALIVTLLTVLVSLFNWGLGLIFGAILVRKVGENARKNRIQLNYPLIGAAGYSGLMVWHGGISGSAPIKAADEGHIHALMSGVVPEEQLSRFPESVSYAETIFGGMNLTAMTLVIVVLPLFMYLIGRRTQKSSMLPERSEARVSEGKATGAERLDASNILAVIIGGLMLSYAIMLAVKGYKSSGWSFINPNFINLTLLGMGLTFHGSVRSFLRGVNEAITGSAGILIQFPLYFGIMGIMNGSGLVQIFSTFLADVSSETTFPLYTFLSAGVVNVFVPSGGGQWVAQGPIILKAASDIGVSFPKAIMALSYGDQLTNMLQPFWALPLLGITGLKAREILPYSVALMGVGIVLFVLVLLIF